MRLKILIPVILIFLLHRSAFSQILVSAEIDGNKTATKMVNENPLQLFVNASDYGSPCDFRVFIKYKNPHSPYKRSLAFTTETGERLYVTDEVKDSTGVFHVIFGDSCKIITGQKIVNVMLLENPANDMIMIPSRMQQLAEIHLH